MLGCKILGIFTLNSDQICYLIGVALRLCLFRRIIFCFFRGPLLWRLFFIPLGYCLESKFHRFRRYRNYFCGNLITLLWSSCEFIDFIWEFVGYRDEIECQPLIIFIQMCFVRFFGKNSCFLIFLKCYFRLFLRDHHFKLFGE